MAEEAQSRPTERAYDFLEALRKTVGHSYRNDCDRYSGSLPFVAWTGRGALQMVTGAATAQDNRLCGNTRVLSFDFLGCAREYVPLARRRNPTR